MPRRRRLEVLPIYTRAAPIILLFILAVTVVPTGFRTPALGSIFQGFELWGFAANILLFFPLGLALHGMGLLRAVRRGAAVSMAIELAQLFLEARHTEPADLIANTLGTLCGAAVGHWLGLQFGWRFDRFPLGRMAAFGATLPLIAFGTVCQQRASLWMWDPSHKLAVGDELTRDRTWEGEIFEIAIFNVPLDPAVFPMLAEEGPGSIAANLALFPTAPVFERTTPLNLEQLRGIPLLKGNDERRFFDSLVGAGSFTVLLWCRPARLDQLGPARIVTYSLDTGARNFTIGQEGREVDFRVRTHVSGPNGFMGYARTPPILNDEDVLLAARYDGKVSRIYVNGHLAQETDLSEIRLFWSLWSLEFLPGILILLGALLAIVLLGVTRPRNHRLRWCVAGMVGGAAGVFFLATGGAHPFLGPFVALLAPLGALAVVWGAGPES